MIYSLVSSLILLLVVTDYGLSQIVGYPRQYPGQGGPYPGGSFPIPERSTRINQDNQPTQNFIGVVRKLSTSELVIESDDKRAVTISLFSSTRYYKSEFEAHSGNGSRPPATAKRDDFHPRDRVSVDATQDNNGNFRAAKIAMVKQDSGNSPGTQSASADQSQSAAMSDRPTSDRSVLNRPATTVNPPAPTLDADDAGQPTLQRGTSARNGSPQIGDEDQVIAQAREEAFSFSETLPNYVVKQYTTRYATTAGRGGRISWQAIDTVTADVVSEDGKESYKNVLINGRAPREAVEKTGAWSTGEFSSTLQDILSPATAADFRNKRSTTIVNRAAFRYDFTVEQQNSHWNVRTEAEAYSPGYSGALWIDKASFRVLRIETSAEKIPPAFPLDIVDSAIDYDFVLIGDAKYLLPVHSEALSCRRGTSDCTRNVIDFRDHKKFGAEANITFGSDK